MPEGPSLRKWCEVAQQFTGRTITNITGTTSAFDKELWDSSIFSTVQVYGKQMFVQLSHKTPVTTQTDSDENSMWLRYHFLMWGSLHANQYKGPSKRSKTKVVPNPRMVLHFQEDQFLAFYGGSLRKVDGPCEDTGVDILSDTFDIPKAASAVLQDAPVCYSLMDQTQFAGLGNIIKNEVLYRTNTHPLELGTTLSKNQAVKIAEQVVTFTRSWMAWEKEPNGKKFNEQMMIYWKFKCPLGHSTKRGWFGDGLKRMTVWCPECQPLIKESDIYKTEIVNTKKVKRQSKKDDLSSEDKSPTEKKAKKRKASSGDLPRKKRKSSSGDLPKKKRKASSGNRPTKPKRARRSAKIELSDEDFDDSNVFEMTKKAIQDRKRSSARTSVKAAKNIKAVSKGNQPSKGKRNVSVTVKRKVGSDKSSPQSHTTPASKTERGIGMTRVPKVTQGIGNKVVRKPGTRLRDIGHTGTEDEVTTTTKIVKEEISCQAPGTRRSARLAINFK